MSRTRTVAVTVVIETADPRLDPETIDASTAAKARDLRAAVISNLPGLTRVVAVMPVELAELMHHAHAEAVKAAGVDPMSVLSAPPEDYTTPGDTVPSRYPGISRKRRH
jgi:hypothetical protein